jgi:hypothetical protein
MSIDWLFDDDLDSLRDDMRAQMGLGPDNKPLPKAPTVRECILFMAGNDPDRARVVNGAGFNKLDGDYGHKLARKLAVDWTDWDEFYGYRILAKYAKTQLIPAGLRYDLIKPPVEPTRPPPFKQIVQDPDNPNQVKGEFGSLDRTEYTQVRAAAWKLVGIRWASGGGNTFLITKDAPSLGPLLKFVIEQDFLIDTDLLHELQQIINMAEAIVKASKGTSLKAIGIEDWALKGGWNTEWRGPAMPHQEVAVWYIEQSIRRLHNGGVQVGDEMGLGKTWEALLSAHHMFTDDDWERGLLILVPTHLGIQWEATAKGLLPDRKVTRLASGKMQDLSGDIVICPYSILRYERNKETEKLEPNDILFQLMVRPWAGIVCDESHYLKNDEAMRSSATKEIYEAANPWFRLGMSGTSVVNRPAEYSPQLELLGVMKQFGSRYSFEREAVWHPVEVVERMRGRGVYLRREKLDVLYCKCPDRTQLEKETIGCKVCGGIPIKRREVVVLELSDEWRAKYDYAAAQFRKWLLEEYQGDMQKFMRSMRAELLVRITKLSHQVAEAKLEPFIEWVKDFLDESDQKIVLFAHHVDMQEKLIEAFPGCAMILGSQSMSDAEKVRQEYKFQNDPNVRVMVYTTLGATGRNLTAASNVNFLELEWGPVPHDQAEDRCNRIGSERMLNSRFFLAENTIDQYRMAMIDAKRRITSALNKGEEVDDTDLLANMLLAFMEGKQPPSASELSKVWDQKAPTVDPEEERRQKYDESTGR